MTKTFEQLYTDAELFAGADYAAKRSAKVAEIADYAIGIVRADVDVAVLAESLMSSAEEMGWFDGDDINGEIAGRYTLNGNPCPFTI